MLINPNMFVETTQTKAVKATWLEWIAQPLSAEAPKPIAMAAAAPQTRCMLLNGDSDSGKTYLIKSFVERHRPSVYSEQCYADVPTLLLLPSYKPNRIQIYKQILRELGLVNYVQTNDHEIMRNYCARMLSSCKVRLLICDDVNDIAESPGDELFLGFVACMQDLAELAKFSLVLSGPAKMAERLAASHDSYKRCTDFFKLWPLDRPEFELALQHFIEIGAMPADRDVTSMEGISLIYEQTSGLIGQLSYLLEAAAHQARRRDMPQFNLALIQQHFSHDPETAARSPGNAS